MSAHTGQTQAETIERLTVLFANAVELIRSGKRPSEMITLLLGQLQRFKQNELTDEVPTGLRDRDGTPVHIAPGVVILFRNVGRPAIGFFTPPTNETHAERLVGPNGDNWFMTPFLRNEEEFTRFVQLITQLYGLHVARYKVGGTNTAIRLTN